MPEKHILAERDYMSGMKYKDIAEKYSVSINTVKSWRKRHGWSRKKGAPKIEKVCTQKTENREVAKKVAKTVSSNNKLTDEQKLFCIYFSKTFSAVSAYQKAYGCSYESAAASGSRLLTTNQAVQDEVNRLKEERLAREYLRAEDVFQKYMDVAFADMTDFLEWGMEEVPVMTPYGQMEVEDPETGEMIKVTKKVNTIRFKESSEVDGTLIGEVRQGKDGASLKLPDRLKALEWLADHLDLATKEQAAKVELIKAQMDKAKAEAEIAENKAVMLKADGKSFELLEALAEVMKDDD